MVARAVSQRTRGPRWARGDSGHQAEQAQRAIRFVQVPDRGTVEAEQVVVMAYGRGVDPWWSKVRPELNGLANVRVFLLSAADSTALAARASRNMTLHVLVQEGVVSITDAATSLDVSPTMIFGA